MHRQLTQVFIDWDRISTNPAVELFISKEAIESPGEAKKKPDNATDSELLLQ